MAEARNAVILATEVDVHVVTIGVWAVECCNERITLTRGDSAVLLGEILEDVERSSENDPIDINVSSPEAVGHSLFHDVEESFLVTFAVAVVCDIVVEGIAENTVRHLSFIYRVARHERCWWEDSWDGDDQAAVFPGVDSNLVVGIDVKEDTLFAAVLGDGEKKEAPGAA